MAGGCGVTDPRFFRSIEFSALTLRVAELPHVLAFYEDVLGFEQVSASGEAVPLAPPGAQRPLVVLHSSPGAPPRPRGAAGLFHVAFLYPDRAALGRVLQRLTDLGLPIGSADHGVSEAIYLSDPEGNGIELYADRPEAQWPPPAPDGQVTMFTEALEGSQLLALGRTPGPLLPEATRIGHVHLSVADLSHAEQFYAGLLGFAVRQRSYPGALFLGRDGYHHHLGANIWRSRQAAAPGCLGMSEVTLHLTDAHNRNQILERLRHAGRIIDESDRGIVCEDLDRLRFRISD